MLFGHPYPKLTLINCFKELNRERRVYILAVDLDKDSVEENIINGTFYKYIISAIERKVFRKGYDFDKDISENIIVNSSQKANTVSVGPNC